MGKTAVFVLATLQQLEVSEENKHIHAVVVCHVRELAFQIHQEFERFKKYLRPVIQTKVVYGGIPIALDRKELKANVPHILIATPGRLLALAQEKSIDLTKVKHFILDECDQMLGSLGMKLPIVRNWSSLFQI